MLLPLCFGTFVHAVPSTYKTSSTTHISFSQLLSAFTPQVPVWQTPFRDAFFDPLRQWQCGFLCCHSPVYFPVEVMYKVEFSYKDRSWTLSSTLCQKAISRAAVVPNVYVYMNLNSRKEN